MFNQYRYTWLFIKITYHTGGNTYTCIFSFVSWEGLKAITVPKQETQILPRFWFLISFHNNRNQDSEEMADSRTEAKNIQDEGRACCSAKKWEGFKPSINGAISKSHRKELWLKKLPSGNVFLNNEIQKVVLNYHPKYKKKKKRFHTDIKEWMNISRENNKCISCEQFQVISVEMTPLRRRSIILHAYVLAEHNRSRRY